VERQRGCAHWRPRCSIGRDPRGACKQITAPGFGSLPSSNVGSVGNLPMALSTSPPCPRDTCTPFGPRDLPIGHRDGAAAHWHCAHLHRTPRTCGSGQVCVLCKCGGRAHRPDPAPAVWALSARARRAGVSFGSASASVHQVQVALRDAREGARGRPPHLRSGHSVPVPVGQVCPSGGLRGPPAPVAAPQAQAQANGVGGHWGRANRGEGSWSVDTGFVHRP